MGGNVKVTTALLAGLVVFAGAGHATAKTAAPIAMTYYLHGTAPVGEAETSFPPMDSSAPTASDRSWGVLNYVGGPNTKCAGNRLFPVWLGTLHGTPTGNATVTLFTESTGGALDVRLFRDVDAQACNDAYPDPIGEASVPAPPSTGKVTVVLKNINPKRKAAKFGLMLQISPSLGTAGLIIPPHVTRVLYDSAASNASVSFRCIPNAGAAKC